MITDDSFYEELAKSINDAVENDYESWQYSGQQRTAEIVGFVYGDLTMDIKIHYDHYEREIRGYDVDHYIDDYYNEIDGINIVVYDEEKELDDSEIIDYERLNKMI